MRIDQLISQAMPFSRKEVKALVRQKRVMVNGLACRDPGLHVGEHDLVMLDDAHVEWPRDLYYMLNKPSGYCCSHEDDGAVSALKLLPPTGKKLHFAGRLDADTTGLVLVSSNGHWCHRVTSPKQRDDKCKYKHYRVTLAMTPSPADIAALQQGIMLNGESSPTLPAIITLIDSHTCEIAISEGRYHQVKRMFAATGNHVKTLHRFRIGNIELDSTLGEGEYRQLSGTEIEGFSHDT